MNVRSTFLNMTMPRKRSAAVIAAEIPRPCHGIAPPRKMARKHSMTGAMGLKFMRKAYFSGTMLAG